MPEHLRISKVVILGIDLHQRLCKVDSLVRLLEAIDFYRIEGLAVLIQEHSQIDDNILIMQGALTEVDIDFVLSLVIYYTLV